MGYGNKRRSKTAAASLVRDATSINIINPSNKHHTTLNDGVSKDKFIENVETGSNEVATLSPETEDEWFKRMTDYEDQAKLYRLENPQADLSDTLHEDKIRFKCCMKRSDTIKETKFKEKNKSIQKRMMSKYKLRVLGQDELVKRAFDLKKRITDLEWGGK